MRQLLPKSSWCLHRRQPHIQPPCTPSPPRFNLHLSAVTWARLKTLVAPSQLGLCGRADRQMYRVRLPGTRCVSRVVWRKDSTQAPKQTHTDMPSRLLIKAPSRSVEGERPCQQMGVGGRKCPPANLLPFQKLTQNESWIKCKMKSYKTLEKKKPRKCSGWKVRHSVLRLDI